MDFENSPLFLLFTDFEKSRGQGRVSHLQCHGGSRHFSMAIKKGTLYDCGPRRTDGVGGGCSLPQETGVTNLAVPSREKEWGPELRQGPQRKSRAHMQIYTS